jgi:glycosyltransferase involved in cell wall biosynthesis
MPSKKKILIFSFAPPENHGGIRVLLYRHFLLRADFDFRLITDAHFTTEEIPHLHLGLGRIIARFKRTRFHKWVQDWQNLIWPLWIPPSVHKIVKSYRPDVVFTIPDNSLSWMAARAAKKYRIPLVSFYMDWVPVMDDHVGHDFTRPVLERRFKKLHKLSCVSLSICQGMLNHLGVHPDARVIHPIPANREPPREKPSPKIGPKTSILYIGNTQAFYGKILEKLVCAVSNHPNIELQIVGPPPRWKKEVLEHATQKGIYLGYKNSDEVSELCKKADFLLVVMSFEESERLFTETCFPTKISDYTAWGKPLLLWAPEYSSPNQMASKFSFLIKIVKNDPAEVFRVAVQTKNNHQAWQDYAWAALKAREIYFHPTLLQDRLSEAIDYARG